MKKLYLLMFLNVVSDENTDTGKAGYFTFSVNWIAPD